MRTLRRASILLAVGLAAAFATVQAHAAGPSFSSLTEQASSAHFVIHWQNGSFDAARTQSLLNDSEKALAAEVGMGFPAPVDDGDGHIDIYVTPINGNDIAGQAFSQGTDGHGHSSGYIVLDPSKLGQSSLPIVGHEIFHLIQYGYDDLMGSLLMESTARWMEIQLGGSNTHSYPLWAPFDCTPCNRLDATRSPYDRWSLFGFLSNKYGAGIVKEILESAATVDAKGFGAAYAFPTQVLDGALALHGTSLADLLPQYQIAAIPLSSVDADFTLSADSPSAGTTLTVEKLAGRLVRIDARSVCNGFLNIKVSGRGGVLEPQVVVGGTATDLAATADGFTGNVACATARTAPVYLLILNASSTEAASAVDIQIATSVIPATAGSAALSITLPKAVVLIYGKPLPVTVDATRAGSLTVLGGLKPKTLALPRGRTTVWVPLLGGGPRTVHLTFVLLDADGKVVARVLRSVDVRSHS
jgi:hypothetical protein